MNSCIRFGTGLGLAWALCAAALAQTSTPVVVTPAAKPALTPEERAKRDADKVFHWIRLSAEKSAPKPVAAAAPKPAPKPVTKVASKATAEAAPEPAAALSLVAVSDTSSIAPRESEPTAPGPIAAPHSEPVQAPAAAPEPEPAINREPELRLVHRVEPEFPRQLLNTVNSGSVLVRFMIQADGSVTKAEALKTSHRKLSAAALDAVNQWRFAPIASAREATVEIGFSAGE